MMPRGYNSTQSRPLPWLSLLVRPWPGGLCPFGRVTGQAVAGIGCGVPPTSVWTIDDPLVAESGVLSPTDPAVHDVRSNATTTTTLRTLQVHRGTVVGSTPGPPAHRLLVDWTFFRDKLAAHGSTSFDWARCL